MASDSINNRIAELIEELEISKTRFAKLLDTSSSRISNITTNRNKPDSELLSAIVKVFRNVSSEWLLTGEGEMFKQSENERNVSATMYPKSRHLSPENVTYLDKKCDFEAEGDQNVKNKFVLVGGAVQAGYAIDIPTEEADSATFDIPGLSGPGIIIEVRGNSMEPVLREGDYVVCTRKMESWGEFVPDQICVVISSGSGNTVKYVRLKESGIELLSANYEEYPPYIVTFDDLIDLWPVELRITRHLDGENSSPALVERINQIEQHLSKQSPDWREGS